MLKATKLCKHVVLKNEDALIFTSSLDLQRYISLKVPIESLVDVTVGSLAQLLYHFKSIRYF